jgi:hypothetical protein
MATMKTTTGNARVTTAFVDGIDEGVARLVVGNRVLEVPATLLPDAAREGTWIKVEVTPTDPPPDDAAALRQRLGAGDPGGDIKL